MQGYYLIRWRNEDARGSIDLLDSSWLGAPQLRDGLTHPTRHSEGLSIATFDLVPDGDAVLFRYGGKHNTANRAQGIFVGDMRIGRDNFLAAKVIDWRDTEKQPFEGLSVRVERLVAPEGKRHQTAGTRIARNSGLAAWKRAWAKAEGKLECRACGFAGKGAYGNALEHIFEVHHTTALNLGERDSVLPDLALVCANCHRAIHKLGDLSFDNFLERF